MKLREYLDQEKIRRGEFAARIGISQSFLTRLAAGERSAGEELIKRIEEASGGLVAVSDWETTSRGKAA